MDKTELAHLVHFIRATGLDPASIRVAVKHYNREAYEDALAKMYNKKGQCRNCLAEEL